MRIFHVLPVLSLLLGAHAFPVDSSDEASRRLNVRATISEICYPASVEGVAPGIDSQTVCICHPNTGALSALISSGGLVTATNLIVLGLNPGTQGCAYPAYGAPTCTPAAPCAFTCVSGTTLSTNSEGLPTCEFPDP